MKHEFKRIEDIRVVSSGVLDLQFNCGSRRTVDLRAIMHGPLFGELKNSDVFEQVTLDREVGTICWPNGADFDPDTLFHWDEVVGELKTNPRSA